MKPRKYPYSGKLKLIRKELPRFVQLGDHAIASKLIDKIETLKWINPMETVICLKIPKLFAYEEKHIRVQMNLRKVVEVLNQYK